MIQDQIFGLIFFGVAAVLSSLQTTARARNWVVLIADFLFLFLLYVWQPKVFGALLAVLAVNLLGLWVIERSPHWLKIALCSTLISANICCLFVFNYPSLGLMTHSQKIPFFMLGFSFVTLRLIHLAVETCTENRREALTFESFCNFVLFFPAYVAGPLADFDGFTQQLAEWRPLTSESIYSAIERMIVGLFKMRVLGGILSRFSMHRMVSQQLEEISGSARWFSALVFGVWLYVTFSGASDFAIGSGMLFGVRLPENFDRPFLATNLQSFWQRWHMTLLQWVRTYLYYPLLAWLRLGLRFHPLVCTMTALLICYSLLGIWHGDGRNFLLYGLFHGVGMMIYLIYSVTLRPSVAKYCLISRPARMGATTLGWILTWSYVTAGWFFLLGNENLLYGTFIRR